MSLPRNIVPTLIESNLEDWNGLIKMPLSERPHYRMEEDLYSYGTIAGRFLGVPLVEEEYFNMLYDLSKDPQTTFHILNEELDKTIAPERFQSIQEIIEINQAENGLSIGRLIAFMDGKQLIPRHDDPAFYRHVQDTLIEILGHFQSRHQGGLADPEFRRIFIDLVKWLWNHWDPWIQKASITEDMPKVIWYGQTSKSHLYFLYFLMKAGCDVLIFDPEGHDAFAEIDPDEAFSVKNIYERTIAYKPFPKEAAIQRTTVAYNASKEMDHVLHHEASGLYKPWQFRSFIPSSVTLKTTYDELFLIGKEPAFVRPNFHVRTPVIEIPSLFAKIAGVSHDKKEYWQRLHALTEDELAMTIRQFPFTDSTKANYHLHYEFALDNRGVLDPDKMMKGNYWKYAHLPNELQEGLAHVISRFCANPKIKPEAGETEEDLKVFLFKQATLIPEPFLILLQKFDYAQKVPRLVLFNTEKNGTLSRTDAVLLQLLHECGFDVFLYSPNMQNDLEFFVNPEHYATFRLEDVAFDMDFPERDESIIKRMLRNFL